MPSKGKRLHAVNTNLALAEIPSIPFTFSGERSIDSKSF